MLSSRAFVESFTEIFPLNRPFVRPVRPARSLSCSRVRIGVFAAALRAAVSAAVAAKEEEQMMWYLYMYVFGRLIKGTRMWDSFLYSFWDSFTNRGPDQRPTNDHCAQWSTISKKRMHAPTHD